MTRKNVLCVLIYRIFNKISLNLSIKKFQVKMDDFGAIRLNLLNRDKSSIQ